MAKSVRISDPMFEHATLESTLMHRSIALQIEHWCALGRAMEASGVSVDELKRTLQGPEAGKAVARTVSTVPEARMWAGKRERQRADRAAIASGAATPESMHLIPPALARKTTGRFKDVTFGDYA